MTDIDSRRPNTRLPDSVLRRNIVLCCGEDTGELLAALRSFMPVPPRPSHDFRFFRFWDLGGFTLIGTGIGSGCLEPLLFEIFDTGQVRRAILVGTAGAISLSHFEPGRAYAIDQAYLGGCAVHVPMDRQPLRPRFPSLLDSLPRASIVSTDYFYGFSKDDDPRGVGLRRADPSLQSSVDSLWRADRLVDMETGQFYHFCNVLGPPGLEYLAIKAPSNEVSGPLHGSQEALRNTLHHAISLTR